MRTIVNTVVILLVTMTAQIPTNSYAATKTLNKDECIRAIIGEAANQGYTGMLAVACAIRNRGSLQGVYGLKAPHVDQQPLYVWSLARKAWAESAKKDITGGATHWENIAAFGTPYWARGMIQSFHHKDHTFYRRKIK